MGGQDSNTSQFPEHPLATKHPFKQEVLRDGIEPSQNVVKDCYFCACVDCPRNCLEIFVRP